MNAQRFRTLNALVVASLLAGCGGAAQTVTNAVPQAAQQTHKVSGDLMYVSAIDGSSFVFSYPKGKLVGTIAETAQGVCSDTLGNVYLIVDESVMIYAHGATSSSQILSLPSEGRGCAVDPSTNNLAVTLSPKSVAVFTVPYNQATTYQSNLDVFYCGFDDAGNLFADGVTNSGSAELAELPMGENQFLPISLSPAIELSPGTVQWDGSALNIEVAEDQDQPKYFAIDRLAVSGSTATVIGSTTFKGIKHVALQSWIYEGKVIIPYGTAHRRLSNLGIWRYPQGGAPVHLIKHPVGNSTNFSGVTVSVASSASNPK